MSDPRKQYRQGDVLIIESDEPLPDPKLIEPQIAPVRHVVGPGDATPTASHEVVSPSEVIECRDRDVTTYLLVPDGGARLVHHEHAPLELPTGTYRVIRQREYMPSNAEVLAQRSRIVFD